METLVVLAIVAAILYFIVPIILRATLMKPAKFIGTERLDGRIALVTGANIGLGKATVRDLASRGAHVYMACRNLSKGLVAKTEIEEAVPGARLTLLQLDLSSLDAVRTSAEEFLGVEKQLDILVNNAGFGKLGHEKTHDGIELHLGVNHLGHFQLTRLLLPLLKRSGDSSRKSRIINVSSFAHTMCPPVGIDYDGLDQGSFVAVKTAYGQSKLANIYFTKYLNKLLHDDDNVTVNVLHPGTCRTGFFRNYFFSAPWPGPLNYVKDVLSFPIIYMALSDIEGAQTQIYAAVSEEMEGVSGTYLQKPFMVCLSVHPFQQLLEEFRTE